MNLHKILISILVLPAWLLIEVFPELAASRYHPERIQIMSPWRFDRATKGVGMILSITAWIAIIYSYA